MRATWNVIRRLQINVRKDLLDPYSHPLTSPSQSALAGIRHPNPTHVHLCHAFKMFLVFLDSESFQIGESNG
jgi:hypothetical protein